MEQWRVGEARAALAHMDHGWRSDPFHCSICFSELNSTFLRTRCDHLLCKVHEREDNGLPHRCPACKKTLGVKDLTEQEPAFFKSDDEMREFAKRLRPEEAHQLSVYATQFHIKQKNLETVIEARKRARAEKSENKHRAYTKTIADELNAIRPECVRLSAELDRMEQLARELHAAKQEAEDKLAQVNARLSDRLRAPLLSVGQKQQDTSPGFRAGSGGGAREYALAGSAGADAYERHARQRGAPELFQARQVCASTGGGCGGNSCCGAPGTPIPTFENMHGCGQAPHVNKRLRPSCEVSPRNWGDASPCAGYQLPARNHAGLPTGGSGMLNPTPPRTAAHAAGSAGAAGYYASAAVRAADASHQPIVPGLLNPHSTTVTPVDEARRPSLRPMQQQAQFVRGGAGGARNSGGAPSTVACDSPVGAIATERFCSQADQLASVLNASDASRRRYG